MKFTIGVYSFVGNTLLILLLCWAFITLYSEIVNEYQNKLVEKQTNIEGVNVLSAKSDLTVSDVKNYDRQYGSNLYASLERPLIGLSGSRLSAQAKLQKMSSDELKTSLKNEEKINKTIWELIPPWQSLLLGGIGIFLGRAVSNMSDYFFSNRFWKFVQNFVKKCKCD